MKKKFVSLALCMAFLSSFSVSVSAAFDDTDSSNLNTLTQYTASLFQSASFRNSTYRNWCYMLGDALTDIYNVNSGLVQRVIEIQSMIDASNQHLGALSSSLGSIDAHIGSGFELTHSDLSLLYTGFFSVHDDTLGTVDGVAFKSPISYVRSLGHMWFDIAFDGLDGWSNQRTLYSLIKQLQEVLASDDDLQLKKDNKANQDAAADAFVNGNSSQTSLGTGDIGNLKDVGASFNDLTSLNGQSSVSSFLNGLSSADGTGQGWFSEATRASLDAVSAPVITSRIVQKTWRGEKSLTYSISADTSVNLVASPAPVRDPAADADPAADPDPYNMSGFEDNYNWLWGDVS